MYAEVALNVPVRGTFDYHVPDALLEQVRVGHLVQVAFRTAEQAGIVVGLHEQSAIEQTKPLLDLLDLRPVVTLEQIDIARWISEYYLMPLGACLWLFLPPGLTGRRDIEVTLGEIEAKKLNDLETEILALLRRRGPLRGQQLNLALSAKQWREAVDALAKAGVLSKRNILAPPRARPKLVRRAALAIQPDQITHVARHLGRKSKQADLLEVIAAAGDEGLPIDSALRYAETSRATLKKLIDTGWVATNQDDRTEDEPPLAWSELPRESLDEALISLRKGERFLRVLRILAREDGPMDVSWLYAQADAKLADLKRLEEEGLVVLGEAHAWRDSLAERDFVPSMAPGLTPEQQQVWAVIESRIKRWDWAGREGDTPHPPTLHPSPALPEFGEGAKTEDATPPPNSGEVGWGSENERRWRSPRHLWEGLKPLAREKRKNPTPAEDRLWQRVRRKQLGIKFRRQHSIERFIVDFIAPEAWLVVEVDGEIHQYTPEEDSIRQEFLEAQGLRVLRISNAAIDADLDSVVAEIEQALAEPLPEGFDAMRFESLPSDSIFLLHGVTGSGKTEIYLRAIELTLAQGRQALFLVPEIALTPQTIRRVAARFPGQVAIMHGSLSEGERYDTWRRARDGLINVVVGARSALYTPFPDLGLIVVDEEHDPSYKQGAGSSHPYYHVRDVAEEMMRQNDGLLIMGSATPDVSVYFRAQRGDIQLLELPQRIMGHRERILEQSEREGVMARYYPARAEDALMIDLPEVEVIDMRRELKAGNTGMFSHALDEALKTVLDRHEQAMLFINRRGSNTYVFCRDCGHVEGCPNCDTPLTYHAYDDRLRCHMCGFDKVPPFTCPECKSRRIRYFGAGTQQVEEELHRRFPMARVVRWDSDTARSPADHEELLQRFIDRKADILIGTQMVAKGLDLPLVTLVGMVSADLGLNLPDFRAGERNFQLLTQVAGRAGRGLLGGRAVLQTYQPEHYVIQTAAAQDYARFFQRELAYRRELGYPPYRRLARIVIQLPSESRCRSEAERAARLIERQIQRRGLSGTEMIGPAPCFFGKVNNVYRWHLLLRSPDPTLALEGVDIPRDWLVDIDPVNLL